jgi:hypothetical protein
VAAVILLAIGNEIARGIGLVGALTLIRFRSTLKDTRDLIFGFRLARRGCRLRWPLPPRRDLGQAVFIVAVFTSVGRTFGSRRPFERGAEAYAYLPIPPASVGSSKCLQGACTGITLVEHGQKQTVRSKTTSTTCDFADPGPESRSAPGPDGGARSGGATLFSHTSPSLEI